MRAIRLLAILMVSLALLGVTARARAQADEKDEAKSHFDNGIALISGETKDYAAALVEFQASVRLHATKSGLYNLGLCNRRLGRYGEALEAFARLESEFGPSLDAAMRQDAQWEAEAIRKLTVELDVQVDHPGASIWLNGELLGQSPLPKPLVLGPREHRLEVELEGFERVQRKLALEAGQRRLETVHLVPVPGKLMVATEGTVGAVVLVDGQRMGITPLAAPLPVPPGEHLVSVTKDGYEPLPVQRVSLQAGGAATITFARMRRAVAASGEDESSSGGSTALAALPWVGAALTVTGGIFSGVLWSAASQRYDDFSYNNDQIAAGTIKAGDPSAAEVDGQRQSAADGVTRYRNGAIATTVASGALAVVTVVLFVLDYGAKPAAGAGVGLRPDGLELQF